MAAILAISLSFAGCMKEGEGSSSEKNNHSYFDFATARVSHMDVRYGVSGYRSGIMFEVYAENPFNEAGGRTAVKPLFKARTDRNGRFSGPVSLPSFLESVYIVADAYVDGGVARVALENGSIIYNAAAPVARNNAASRAGSAYSVPAGFHTLGGWDQSGMPDYMNADATVPAGLMTEINNILVEGRNLSVSHPEFVYDGTDLNSYTYQNIDVTEACQIDFMFLYSNALLSNTIGYYTYPTGQRPASPEAIEHRTVIFPVISGSAIRTPLVAGDNVRLKYWNGAEYVDSFPAGVTVGFFMLPAGYSSGSGDVTLNNLGASAAPIYSDQQFNCLTSAPLGNRRQQTVALYNKPRELVVIGFEDITRGSNHWYQDHDFNDAIFACMINPYTIDVPDDHNDNDLDPTDPEPQGYEIEYEGTLAFEDLWPNKGDYDMNDVGIRYHSTVYYNANNEIYKSVDVFTPVCKGGQRLNGFGFQYGVDAARVKNCQLNTTAGAPVANFPTLPGMALEAGQSKAVVMLFNDVAPLLTGTAADIDKSQQQPLHTYTVVTEFNNVKVGDLGFPPYNPFIVVKPEGSSDDQRIREIHLTNYRPTDKCTDPAGEWFGMWDDKSDKANYWYVSDERFPFAINIPTASFRFPDEYQRIDNAYPRFANWVATHGAQDADWWR